MDRSLFRYIWRSTKRQQIWILAVILASMPITFLLLDLPKHIVNGPIQGRPFKEPGATEKLFNWSFSLPDWIGGGKLTIYEGHDFDRLGSLIVLSVTFLFLVMVSGLFKFYINTYKGRLGERQLQQLRYELFDRVLRFPLNEFRRVKGSEIATMIKDEVEPLGGFIGDAFVQPVFLGGQIITALAFIVMQNVSLGMIAIGLLAVQGIVIPRLRRKQLELSRARQITARQLAGRIGEVVEDIPNIRTNDIANYQRADIAARLTKIFAIRFSLYQWKFFIKFLNNLLAQVTPFLFYLLGGYFAIRGQLDIGQLVAVIGAYKDLPSPVKDLIDWDQQRLDVDVKYRQVMEQFSLKNLEEPVTCPDEIPAFEGDISVNNLSVTDYSGARLLDDLSFRMHLNDIVAVVGPAKGGTETLAEVLARLIAPTSGRIQIGGRSVKEWPEAALGRRLSYAASDTYFPQSTIADALLSGLRHGPPVPIAGSKPNGVIDAGGLNLDFDGDWLNYEQAGVRDAAELCGRMRDVLVVVDLYKDVVKLGLNRPLAVEVDETLEKRILEARSALRQRLEEKGLTDLIAPFDPESYNPQSTLAENLLFGTAISDVYAPENLGRNTLLLKILDDGHLGKDLFEMGKSIAQTINEVFEGLSPDNPLFGRLALVSADRLPVFAAALTRIGGTSYEEVAEPDRSLFLELAFAYVEPRDRLGMLERPLEDRIVKARAAFRASLGKHQQDIAFYDPTAYNKTASIQDNILFGRIAYGVAQAETRVQAQLDEVIDTLELRQTVFQSGLTFNIGNGGKRLTTVQRQKLTLARGILRRPVLLLAHRTLSTLDHASQTTILRQVLDYARQDGDGTLGILWFLSNPRLAEYFDRVLVLDDGRLVEDDTPGNLQENGGYLVKLVA